MVSHIIQSESAFADGKAGAVSSSQNCDEWAYESSQDELRTFSCAVLQYCEKCDYADIQINNLTPSLSNWGVWSASDSMIFYQNYSYPKSEIIRLETLDDDDSEKPTRTDAVFHKLKKINSVLELTINGGIFQTELGPQNILQPSWIHQCETATQSEE